MSVLSIAVKPGAEGDLVHAFAEHGVFEHARRNGGFLEGRLLRPLAEGEPFLVIADWESPESYQRWLDDPVRNQLSIVLEPLLVEHPGRGGLYEEAH